MCRNGIVPGCNRGRESVGRNRDASGVSRVVVAAIAVVLSVPAGPPSLLGQATKQVKVVFESRQSGSQSRDAVQGTGGVIVTERGARTSGRVGAESTQRTLTRTTGIFTIVQDGGESALIVASQVPYPQLVYYHDYLTRAGYVATSVAFTDVGASLKVRATLLSGNQVRLRPTPRISWFTRQQAGIAEVTEASTEVIVPSGRPVALGGTACARNKPTP